MRLTHSLLVLGISTLVLLSCSKSKDNGAPLFDSDKVRVWAGQDTVITINTSPGSNSPTTVYTAASTNEQVASVVVQGNTLLIHTSLPGSATIQVKGPGNNSSTITVYTNSVVGVWRRGATAVGGNADVDILCSDPGTETLLLEQLLEKDTLPQSVAGYEFGNKPAFLFRLLKADKTMTEGTYTFRDLTLTLTEGNNTEVYRLLPLGLKKFGLQQDLTTRYQSLYPGKGITRVIQTRYFYDALPPG